MTPTRFEIGPEIEAIIERRMGHEGEKWAIVERGCVMNKSGSWEYEPFPSSRTDEFLERTRFDSADEACDFYYKTVKQNGWDLIMAKLPARMIKS